MVLPAGSWNCPSASKDAAQFGDVEAKEHQQEQVETCTGNKITARTLLYPIK